MGTIPLAVSQLAAVVGALFLHYIKLEQVSSLLGIRGERYYGVHVAARVAHEPNAHSAERLLPEYLDYRPLRQLALYALVH